LSKLEFYNNNKKRGKTNHSSHVVYA